VGWLSDLIKRSDEENAWERMQEIQVYLEFACLHYGPVTRKFNGGRGSLFCDLCEHHIGDLGPGQLRIPVRIES